MQCRVGSVIFRAHLPFLLIARAPATANPPDLEDKGSAAMSSDEESRNSNANAELEREIRQRRKFTAQEAIGRLAGSGAMSGGSVVSRQQEAENEVAYWIRTHVDDPAGSLHLVLNRQIKGSELLLTNIDRPLLALRIHCDRLLASDHLLKEFVREIDVEWGRAMDERPYFEREGAMADPNDPYTVESVRCTLSAAIERLDRLR